MKKRTMTRQGVFFFWSAILTVGGLLAVLKDFNPPWKKFQTGFVALTLDRAKKQIDLENAKVEMMYRQRLEELDTKIRERTDANRSLNHQALIDAKKAEITRLQQAEYEAGQKLSFVKSELGNFRSKYEFLKNDSYARQADVEYFKKLYDEKFAESQKLTPGADAAYQAIVQAKAELVELEKGAADFIRDRDKIFADQARWRSEVDKINPNDAVRFTANVVRDLPLLDFIDPKFNLKQIVLDDLPDLTKSAKVDRCVTCHLGIADPGYADKTVPAVYRTHPKLDLFVGIDSPHPVEKFGCTSCHLGRGYGTSFTLASHTPNDEKQAEEWKKEYGWSDMHYWDYPMLPRRNREAMCISCHKPTQGFELTMARSIYEGRQIYERRGCHGCHKIDGISDELKKIGPTLTHVSAKLDPNFVPRWIAGPRKFYPETAMPHAFGHAIPSKETFPNYIEHTEHQLGEGYFDEQHKEMERDEAVVIESIAAYLSAQSKELELDEPPAEAGDATKGEALVKVVNCLGCHKLDQMSAEGQGYAPDLSKIGSKTNRKWLYNWLRDPKKYWPDGKMPNPRLTDAEANDVAAYLLTLKDDAFMSAPTPTVTDGQLEEMTIRFKRAKMGEDQAKKEAAAMSTQERRTFIGKEAIYRNGCFGCHDIAGFETQGKIGAELTAEGFKEIELFDFGMHKFVHIPHMRHEWIEQKVKQPSIYFLGKVENPYEQKLRMPWFGFSPEEASKIATFILGQTGKPIPAKYRYEPRGAKEALAKGRKIIERKNCAGCHKIGLGEEYVVREDFNFQEHLVWVSDPVVAPADPNLPEKKYSKIVQTKTIGAKDKVVLPPEGFIQSTALTVFGKDFLSMSDLLGKAPVPVDIGQTQEVKVDLDRPELLKVLGRDEAYIWKFYEERAMAPPVLRREGAKIRPEWFFKFLKHVDTVRNHIEVRMPQWDWTDEEATAVVAYFSAAANEPYPFKTEATPPLADAHKQTAKELFGLPGTPEFNASLQCLGCHPAGKLMPTNAKTQWGPNLYLAQARLKTEFIHSWLTNPQAWAPGTRMPNVFYDYSEGGDTPSKLRDNAESEMTRLTEMLYHMPQIEEIRIAADAAAEAAEKAKKDAPPAEAEEFSDDDSAGAAKPKPAAKEEEFVDPDGK